MEAIISTTDVKENKEKKICICILLFFMLRPMCYS
jgi:hypothetical protein